MKSLQIYIALLSMVYLLYIPQGKSEQADTSTTKQQIHLNIYLEKATVQDTLIVSVSHLLGTMFPWLAEPGIKKTMNDKGFFEFEIPVRDSCGYFQLLKTRNSITEQFPFSTESVLPPQFWEAGDSLTIKVSFEENPDKQGALKSYAFDGPSSLKYDLAKTFNYQYFKFDPDIKEKTNTIPPSDWNGNIFDFMAFDSIKNKTIVMLDSLKQYKGEISDLSYEVIKSHIYYPQVQFGLIETFIRTGELSKLDPRSRRVFEDRIFDSYDYPRFRRISKPALDESLDIMALLMNRFRILCYLYKGEYSLDWIYNAIKSDPNISHRIKETLMMRFLLMPLRNSENAALLNADAQQFIKNPQYIELLKPLSASLRGQQIYPFKLPDDKGKIINMKDFKGNVVLLDFWGTGCGACAIFYKNILSKVEDTFKNNKQVTFISINTDRKKETWLKSVNSGLYTSESALNLYTNGEGIDHELIKTYNIIEIPQAILVDKNGNIASFNAKELYNVTTLVEAIQNLL